MKRRSVFAFVLRFVDLFFFADDDVGFDRRTDSLYLFFIGSVRTFYGESASRFAVKSSRARSMPGNAPTRSSIFAAQFAHPKLSNRYVYKESSLR